MLLAIIVAQTQLLLWPSLCHQSPDKWKRLSKISGLRLHGACMVILEHILLNKP